MASTHHGDEAFIHERFISYPTRHDATAHHAKLQLQRGVLCHAEGHSSW